MDEIERCNAIDMALTYLRRHLGDWVTQERLMDVSESKDIWRGMRSARQHGWPVEFDGTGRVRLIAGPMGEPRGVRRPVLGAQRNRVLERDNGRCRLCGVAAGETASDDRPARTEIDHIIPVDHGGLTEDDNLQTLCHVCNHDRQTRMLAERRNGATRSETAELPF